MAGRQEWARCAVDELRAEGLEIQPRADPDTGPSVGIIFSSKDSPALRSALAAVDPRRHRVMVVGPPDGSLDPWQVLGLGAAECAAWREDTGAAAVFAWVQRELEVERTLASKEIRAQLLGASSALKFALRDLVVAARYGTSPILVLGETGTGKELAARVAHSLGAQHDGNLVVVDCTTIVPSLLGSELFGHERGAFTGAVTVRTGACSAADNGSLFLDEVGELPFDLQPELLRVVQEGTYKRVGGDRWLHSRFRLICATNRDLKSEVAEGRFRADLYHRIAAATVTMPPLRDRRSDVLALFMRFYRDSGAPEGHGMDPAVERALLERDYPGNLRDLRQLAARVASRHVGPGSITPGDLPAEDRPGSADSPVEAREQAVAAVPVEPFRAAADWALDHGLGLSEIKEGAADMAVAAALERCGGRVREAAAALGISDRAVQLRLAERSRRADRRSQTPAVSSAESSRQ